MSLPLKWAEGDRAAVARDGAVFVGVIEGLDGECASLRVGERIIFCSRAELDLVPLAIPPGEPVEEREEDDLDSFIHSHEGDDDDDPEQGIPDPHPDGRGRDEGAPHSGGVRPAAHGADDAGSLPGRLDGARPAEPRSVDHADEARGGELLRDQGDGVRAGASSGGGDYSAFIARKLTRAPSTGLKYLPPLHASLFDFQKDLVAWALRRGRAAIFADTGLGKTRMQLEWARRVADYAGGFAAARDPGKILILAPLAVAAQTVEEGKALGIEVTMCRGGEDVRAGVNITNYDRLHRFDPSIFDGVVLDESSIIKHHDAKTLARLLEAFRGTPFKLCATATPSPNDFTELGTHAEFLGVCTRQEMLAEYFVHDGGSTQDWRLKGHARGHFWRWVATWAALIRKPSDLGYDIAGYDLPELVVTQHTIAADVAELNNATVGQTSLFAEPAKTLTERRAARRGSLPARVERCVATVLAEPDEAWVIWCELNDEADALRKALDGAVEIRGADEPLLKEQRLIGFAKGEFKILITKPSIAGFGLNWQHAARMAFVGVKDSFEAYYQSIRREWRFGQRRPVHVHVFASELEGNVVENLRRKERDALRMAEELGAETREAVRAEVRGTTRSTNDYSPAVAMTRPAWLTSKGNAA